MRWEIRARPRPNADKSLGNEQSSQQDSLCVSRAERQILSDSVSSISIEECFMWACLLNTASVFWQKVPLNFLWPPITMIKVSPLFYFDQKLLFIAKLSPRLLWYQSDVLWCNSILSESCLVSNNKLAWLRPRALLILDSDTGHYHPVMRLSISYLPEARRDFLRKCIIYCKIGSWEDLTEIFVEKGFYKKQFATNGQYVLTFMAFRSWHEWKANPGCIPASAWLPINPMARG